MSKDIKKSLVDIVLPTYNGEKYIGEQLDSLLSQTYSNTHIYIRDDKSKDRTMDILMKYQKEYADKITVIHDEKGNLGVTNNVMEIMRYTKAPYVMFSDQDDVWFDNKVSVMLMSIKKKECIDKNMPILVFADAYVTDENLRIINESFCFDSGMSPKKVTFQNLLQVNPMIGAACIYNRKLVEQALKLKSRQLPKTLMHDWWMAAVAAAFGKIYFRKKQLMYYRQHSNNVVGMHYSVGLLKFFFSDDKGKNQFRYNHYLLREYILCKEIKKHYYGELSEKNKGIIDIYMDRRFDIKKYIKRKLYKEYTLRENIYRILFGIE